MATQSILFVGGGSGGHINPLLAVMAAVQSASSVQCHYVGTTKDMAYPSIAQSPLAFERHVIRSGKLNRFVTWRHVPELSNVALGVVQAYRLLARLRPTLIFSKGGAASVPVALAAHRLNIPVFCHETDVVAGLANRMVARTARRIFTAFPIEDYAELDKEKALYVGQPVREEFYRPESTEALKVGDFTIDASLPLVVVTGGSQGGHGLNQLVRAAWVPILEVAQLVHIAGPRDEAEYLQEAKALPSELAGRLLVRGFIQSEMPALLNRSAVIISRSGGAVFEIAATRKPAVLVPLPTAAQDHQRANARVLEAAQAAIVVDPERVTAEAFAAIVRKLLADQAQRERLSAAIARFDRSDAARRMAQELLNHLT